MLEFIKDVVITSMMHDTTGYYVFKDLATYTSKGYWPVVAWLTFPSLFVDCYNICLPPVLRHFSSIV